MYELASLIMLLFSILATVLIMLMAGMAIILLLLIFSITAVFVGAKQQSVFKGLRVLIYSSSLLIITPLTYLMFKTYVVQFISLSQNSLKVAAITTGILFSIAFAVVSYKTFEKITKIIFNKISKKV